MSNQTEIHRESKPLSSSSPNLVGSIVQSFQTMAQWAIHHPRFIIKPGTQIDDLTIRVENYEKERSQRRFLSRLNAPLTKIGILIILIIVSFAVFAPWISDYTRDELTGLFSPAWGRSSPDHPLGTTKFGRDILGRAIFGARTSLTIALPAIIISVVVGTILGVIAAYYGGWLDNAIMFFTDILLSFPGLILALILVSILGNQSAGEGGISILAVIALTYGFLGIPNYARLIRSQVLQAKELTYVEAAEVIGASNGRIMFKHILPNVFSPVLISFTFDLGGIILSLAGLSFLGFGDPNLIEWGNDINIGRSYLYDAPQAAFWPGFMILITVLGFMLLGDGLRDALDPKMKNL